MHRELDGADFPVVDWFALVLLKLYADGPIDFQDAQKASVLRVSKRLDRVLKNFDP